tara:strand:- start:695 stop:949 length:255 start_codon:yes stop_codon:yes gene_type:complete
MKRDIHINTIIDRETHKYFVKTALDQDMPVRDLYALALLFVRKQGETDDGETELPTNDGRGTCKHASDAAEIAVRVDKIVSRYH